MAHTVLPVGATDARSNGNIDKEYEDSLKQTGGCDH